MKKGKGILHAVLLVLTIGSTMGPAAAEMKILPEDGSQGFGAAVSVSDGFALIGAPMDDDRGIAAGAAYVFKEDSGGWRQVKKLTASTGLSHDYFGASVAVTDAYALVGSLNDKDRGYGAGAAYLYARDSDRWNLRAKLLAGDAGKNDNFGCGVALSGDVAAVGAFREDSRGEDAGAVYVFRGSGGWSAPEKLTAGDGGPGDHFGRSVSVSGNTLIVGAAHDDDRGTDAGAAYLFVSDGSSWSQAAKLTASDGSAGDLFGASVSVSGDWAAIGAWGDDDRGIDAGAVYLFKREGGTWRQTAKRTAADGAAGMCFGRSVALSGSFALVGTGDRGGAAYLFENTGSGWLQQNRLTPATPTDRYGVAVGLSALGAHRNLIVGGDGAPFLYSEDLPGPRIAVTPLQLTITATGFQLAAGPRSSLNQEPAPVSIPLAGSPPDQYATGVLIPEPVIAFWEENPRPPQRPRAGLPGSKDWSRFDSPAKNQGACGSCWAFAAAGLVENLAAQAGLIGAHDLSEQVLLSCAKGDCGGGWYWDALDYTSSNGLPTEPCYPYQERTGVCADKCDVPELTVKIGSFTAAQGLWGEDQTVDDLRLALQQSPLCVCMRVPVDGTFTGYQGGIYDYTGTLPIAWSQAHAVLVVGYDDNEQCFKVKNSWGPEWGENGYFRIAYNDVIDAVKFGSYAVGAGSAYSGDPTLVIANQGDSPLLIHNIASDKTWLAWTPSSLSPIGTGERRTLSISVNDWGRALADGTAGLSIHSNDPNQPLVSVTVTVVEIEDPPNQCPVPGDIDGDCHTDLTDAIIALQVLAGVVQEPGVIRGDFKDSEADIGGDDRITLAEAVHALERVADGR